MGGLDVGLAAGVSDSLLALVVMFAAVALAVVVLILLPYIFFLLELLIVPALVLYRVALRRPWTVEASSEGERRRWKVVGWRRSGEVVEATALALERGDTAFGPLGAERATP